MSGQALEGEALEMSLPNDLGEIAGVAARIDEFCAARDLRHVAYAVNLAIDEILTNTISCGYDDDERHRIEIIVRMEEASLVVVIVDDSMPFDLGLAPERDLDVSLDETPLGGLGLYLVHQMMDTVEYSREEGCNIVILRKNTAEGDGQAPPSDWSDRADRADRSSSG